MQGLKVSTDTLSVLQKLYSNQNLSKSMKVTTKAKVILILENKGIALVYSQAFSNIM
jgi:hypothetical protein